MVALATERKSVVKFTTVIDSRKRALRDLDDLTSDPKAICALDSEFDPDQSLVVFSRSRRRGERVVIFGEFAQSVYADWLVDRRFRKVYSNFKADCRVFDQFGFDLRPSFYADIVIMDWLVDENPKKHGLKDQVLRHLHRKRKDFRQLFSYVPPGKKKGIPLKASQVFGFEPLPEEALLTRSAEDWFNVGVEYSGDDAEDLILLFWKLRKEIEAFGYWQNYLRYDRPFTHTIMGCEDRGIRLDVPRMLQIKAAALIEKRRCEHVIKNDLGLDQDFNLNAKEKLRAVLLDLDWPTFKDLITKKTGQPQVSAEAWKRWSKLGFDTAKTMLKRNTKDKLVKDITSFMNGMSPDGRVRTDLNQVGAKCLPAGELVLTARGYVPVERVTIGDVVLTHEGRGRRVSDRGENGVRPIYQITLDNGLSLRVTGNHSFLSTDKKWVEAKDLTPSTPVVVHTAAPEEWKRIYGWPQYKVSSWGRVKNRFNGRCLTQQPKGKWGHLKVCLVRNGATERGPDRKDFPVHRLVALAFVPGCSDACPEVRHINGLSWDNRAENLQWGSSRDNRQDAIRHGTMHRRVGANSVSEEAVAFIRSLPFHKGVDAKIASLLGVCREHVRDIRLGKRLSKPAFKELCVGFSSAKVASVVLQKQKLMTYGLSVEEDHSHVTGGVVTHNTGRISSRKKKEKVLVEKVSKRGKVTMVEKTIVSGANLANIVAKGEKDTYGVRNCFIAPKKGEMTAAGTIAEEDYELVVADESGFELVVAIEMAQRVYKGESSMYQAMLKYGSPSAVHALTAIRVLGVPLTMEEWKKVKDLSPDEYRLAKIFNFGLIYGGTEFTMARKRGQDPNDEAILEENRRHVEKFFEMYPEMVALQRWAIQHARKYGYVPLLCGRRRRLQRTINSFDNRERRHAENQARNASVQGFCASIIKVAMNNIEKDEELKSWNYRQLMQVYDEIVGEAPASKAQQCLERVIQHMMAPFAWKMKVKLAVEGGHAREWGKAKR